MRLHRTLYLLSPVLLLAQPSVAQSSVEQASIPAHPPLFQPPVKSGPAAPPASSEAHQPSSVLTPLGEPSGRPASVLPAVGFEGVIFDRPDDRDLWARGASYKARFGADAVEFVPFLGSSAPRNFPVTFELESVVVGDVALELARDVEPVLESGLESENGDVVSYDRGSVIEHYVVEHDSIEQRFRLEEALTTTGDIVVRVAVETELGWSEDADGFSFAGELGGVRYGRAVTFDAGGRAAASPTRLVDGGIEIRVPRDFVGRAQFPLTVDPLVYVIAADDTFQTANPDVAFDVTNQTYCVVSEFQFSATDYDIYSQFYSADGEFGLGTGTWVDLTTDDWKRPKIANNNLANEFLVVAVEGGFSGDIVGRTRSAVPTSQGPQFQISGAEPGAKSNPDVGGDPDTVGPTYYSVVWQNNDDDDGDIHARMLNSLGQLAGGVFAIDHSPGQDSRPRISKSCGLYPWGSQRWTVVWMRYVGTSNHDIFGAQISWSGAIAESTFPIAFTGSNDRYPTVSTILSGGVGDDGSGDRPYLVAWIDGADIQGRVYQGNTPLTPTTNLTALEGGANQGYQQLTPCVESDGSSFVMAYAEARPNTGWDVYVSEYDYAAGQLHCTDPNRLAAENVESELNPYMTSQRSAGGSGYDFMAVWHRIFAPGQALVQGATLGSVGFGHIYCDTNPNSSGSAGHLIAHGSRSIAHQDMTLYAVACPPDKPGLFFLGSGQVNLPFGEGRRCVGGAVKRLPVTSTSNLGVAHRTLNFGAPYASGIVAGGVNYQYWFRDPTGGPAGFNVTDGLHVEHTP